MSSILLLKRDALQTILQFFTKTNFLSFLNNISRYKICNIKIHNNIGLISSVLVTYLLRLTTYA